MAEPQETPLPSISMEREVSHNSRSSSRISVSATLTNVTQHTDSNGQQFTDLHMTENLNLNNNNNKRQCSTIYIWSLIFLQIVLFGLVTWVHIYLKFYAPRSHAWNSLVNIYGLDIYTDLTTCRTNHEPSSSFDISQHKKLLVSSPTATIITSQSSCRNIIENDLTTWIQCMSDLYIGSGICQRLVYYGICLVALLLFIFYLVKNDKIDQFSFFAQIFLAFSFIGTLIFLPTVSMRLTIELSGLKGVMSLDWSPPNIISEAWAETQLYGHCCGIDGPGHWKLPISSQIHHSYPASCCNSEKFNCGDQNLTLSLCNIWPNGCLPYEYSKVSLYGSTIVVFSLVQLVLSAYGILLITSIKEQAERRIISYLLRTPNAIAPEQRSRTNDDNPNEPINESCTSASNRTNNNNDNNGDGPNGGANCGVNSSAQGNSRDNGGDYGETDTDPKRQTDSDYSCPFPSGSNIGDGGESKPSIYPKPIIPPKPNNVEIRNVAEL